MTLTDWVMNYSTSTNMSETVSNMLSEEVIQGMTFEYFTSQTGDMYWIEEWSRWADYTTTLNYAASRKE
ncbi:MAG: hypothetical protein CM15mV29_0890 [uncultured marine virus]|jgi:hypothetical protein|nr:MAG: hypothetical protein CM15mV29_0890 [uncultured marine virus]